MRIASIRGRQAISRLSAPCFENFQARETHLPTETTTNTYPIGHVLPGRVTGTALPTERRPVARFAALPTVRACARVSLRSRCASRATVHPPVARTVDYSNARDTPPPGGWWMKVPPGGIFLQRLIGRIYRTKSLSRRSSSARSPAGMQLRRESKRLISSRRCLSIDSMSDMSTGIRNKSQARL